MSEQGTIERRAGRPRDDRVHQAILDATAHLVEVNGYPALTIEEVAATAGVGKSTIYRWWPSKAHLVLEVVTDRWYESGKTPDTGNTRRDLIEFLSVNHRNQMGIGGRVLRQLASDLSDPDELSQTIKERFSGRRRQIGVTIMERAIARGDLPADADVELMLDIAFGIPMAQQFRLGDVRDLRDVDAVVDLLLSGSTPLRRKGRPRRVS